MAGLRAVVLAAAGCAAAAAAAHAVVSWTFWAT
jgi:hypothetical protein